VEKPDDLLTGPGTDRHFDRRNFDPEGEEVLGAVTVDVHVRLEGRGEQGGALDFLVGEGVANRILRVPGLTVATTVRHVFAAFGTRGAVGVEGVQHELPDRAGRVLLGGVVQPGHEGGNQLVVQVLLGDPAADLHVAPGILMDRALRLGLVQGNRHVDAGQGQGDLNAVGADTKAVIRHHPAKLEALVRRRADQGTAGAAQIVCGRIAAGGVSGENLGGHDVIGGPLVHDETAKKNDGSVVDTRLQGIVYRRAVIGLGYERHNLTEFVIDGAIPIQVHADSLRFSPVERNLDLVHDVVVVVAIRQRALHLRTIIGTIGRIFTRVALAVVVADLVRVVCAGTIITARSKHPTSQAQQSKHAKQILRSHHHLLLFFILWGTRDCATTPWIIDEHFLTYTMLPCKFEPIKSSTPRPTGTAA